MREKDGKTESNGNQKRKGGRNNHFALSLPPVMRAILVASMTGRKGNQRSARRGEGNQRGQVS
jgi:hypothetical protein